MRFCNTDYFLPKNLGGFYGQVQYAFGEKASTSANNKQGNTLAGRLGYEKGPLDLAFGFSDWKQVIGASDVAPITIGRDLKIANFGISYDLGMAKIMGLYGREEVKGAVANNSKLDSIMVGALVPVGAGDFKLSYAKHDLKNSANDFSKLAFGYQYKLSKRTTLYTALAQLKNDGAAVRSIALDGIATLTPRAGGKSNGFEMGVRHTF